MGTVESKLPIPFALSSVSNPSPSFSHCDDWEIGEFEGGEGPSIVALRRLSSIALLPV